MITRFIRAALTVALSLSLAGQATAYDLGKANRYPSFDLYRPNADQITLHGEGSTGPVSGMSVKIPDDAAAARSLADILGDLPSVKSFGAKCNGTFDDTLAFSIAGSRGKLYDAPPGRCNVSSFAMSSLNGGKISGFRGAGRGVTYLKINTPAGQDTVTVTGPGGYNPNAGNWTAVFRDMTIDGTGNTAMTGRVFSCQNAAGMILERIMFVNVPNFAAQKDCIFTVALDISGFNLKAGTGIGWDIDGGSFFGDRLFYQSTTPGGVNYDAEAYIKVRQTFGVFLGTGIVSHARRGLYVSTQSGSFAEYSAVGPIQFDQISLSAIELAAEAGSVIRGWQFNGTWASTASNGIYMHAASGGVIYTPELNFVRALNSLNANLVAENVTGLRILGGDYSGAGYVFAGICSMSSADSSVTITSGFNFNVVAGGRPIVIDGQTYTIRNINSGTKAGLVPPQAGVPDKTGVPCSLTSDTQVNISLTGSTTDVTIAGAKIGKTPYAPGTPTFGVFIDRNVDRVSITDNDVSGVPQPIFWNRTSPMSEATFRGNRGANTAYPTIASASTLQLGFADTFTLTGSANVTAFSGPAYPGMQKTVIPTGSPTFTAGNNVGNNFTPTPLVPFQMTFAEGRWFLK